MLSATDEEGYTEQIQALWYSNDARDIWTNKMTASRAGLGITINIFFYYFHGT